ncbi:hypothetical protein XI03_12780 [Bradyrhizobium sp. CCBAU 65884]|nr:hypothetical protein [Bradyrhizobium sp. CCBAU 65884]
MHFAMEIRSDLIPLSRDCDRRIQSKKRAICVARTGLADAFFHIYDKRPRFGAEIANLGEGLLPTGAFDLGTCRKLGFDSELGKSFRLPSK